jgi:glycosyltransferase involved in cell wall biosynthesis
MKILIVYHYIALYREPVFLSLDELDSVEVTLAADTESNNDIELIGCNSSLYKSNFYKLENKWLPKGVLWQRGLSRLLKSTSFDKVIFLGDPHFISTWYFLYKLKKRSVPTFLWTHGFLGRSSKILDRLKLKMYSYSSGLLLYGNEAKVDLVNHGYDSNKLHVINNSLDYESQKKYRERLTSDNLFDIRKKLFANPFFQIVFIGRLTHHKKLDWILFAANELRKIDVNVNILFIGDGEAKCFLEDLTTNYSLNEQVNFYGASHNEEELSSLLCSSDLCVAPGEIGLTAMHSLGYGIPVITHNNRFKQMPEYESIVDGVTGYLYEFGSIESLVSCIKKAVDKPIANVKANCIEKIENEYTPKIQANLIYRALEDE